MSQFLVIGQPLNNLRLISEGHYRTEPQQPRYEKIKAVHTTPSTMFLNVAIVSVLVVLIFAEMNHPTLKITAGLAEMNHPTLKIMAGLIVVFIAAGWIFYPTNRPTQEEVITTLEIFQEVTRFVDDYATAKIEAIQGLLDGVKIHTNGALPEVLAWAKKLYDTPDEQFAVPLGHRHLDYSFAKNEPLSRKTEAMQKNTILVTKYAQKIIQGAKSVPSHIEKQWSNLKQACERLQIANCNLIVIPSTLDDATSWEIAISDPLEDSTSL